VSQRVIQEINSLSTKFIIWPQTNRQCEILDFMKTEGFDGCVGFVERTTIPLYQQLGRDGEVYWDQKKRYLINFQVICDCDKYITLYLTGWPGSCGDSLVFKKMTMHTQPTAHFDPGMSLYAATHSSY
jgi:hypothetical protein